MAVAQVADPTMAFFWTATSALGADWRRLVRASVSQSQLMIAVRDDGPIEIFDRRRSTLKATVKFEFTRGRGAGGVERHAGDLSVLAALRIAQLLGLDLSDAAGNALLKDHPLTWMTRIPFEGTADSVEDLAVELGLVAKRFRLSDLAASTVAQDRLFF